MNKIQSMASKKLAFAGAIVGLIVADAEARVGGWLAYHCYSVAFVAGCYCIAVAIHEGLAAHGVDSSKAEIKAVKDGVAPKP